MRQAAPVFVDDSYVSYPTISDTEDIYAHDVPVLLCGFIGKGAIYSIREKQTIVLCPSK
jgi:hypothetical protein